MSDNEASFRMPLELPGEEYDSDYIYAPIQWYDKNWTAPDIPGNDGWYNISMIKIHLIWLDV